MGKSIFDIDKELYALYDEIEEAGGEITPEMEKKLELNGQEMTNKVKNITNFINNLNADILAIKSETDRLAKLKKSKENTIKGLTNLVLFAIKKYGTEDKKGKKWIDWGTGKVTIRKSETIEVNSKKLEAINDMLKVTFANGIYTGTLNQKLSVDKKAVLDGIVNTAKDSGNQECSEIEIEDLDDVNIEVTVPVKLTDLLKGDGYQLMTNIGAVNRDGWKFKPSIDKKLMKVKIKDDGCVSYIAELVENDNLTIK